MVKIKMQPTQKSLKGHYGSKGKTVYLHIGIWHDKKTDHIHIACPEETKLHSTISDKPESVRYHENLYKKLKEILMREGRWE